MTTHSEEPVSLEEFRRMIDRAGLGMTPEEAAELKPLYDMYAQHIRLVHSVDLQAEEIGVTFHPEWPPG